MREQRMRKGKGPLEHHKGPADPMFQHQSKRQAADSKRVLNSRSLGDCKVTVAVRVRPLNEAEVQREEREAVFCPDQHHLLVSHAGREQAFSFDMVLGPERSQEDIFEACGVKRLVDMAVQGYSCTVFAFGQTGSGKTYTISGPHSLLLEDSQDPCWYGLIQRSLSYLLGQVSSADSQITLSASYLEIYNEQVQDLLNPWPPRPLAVRGSRTRGFRVESLSVEEFHSLGGFMKLLEGGLQNRHTSAHRQNERSSRGHSILTVYIRSETAATGRSGVTQGKLSLVDLAGSERVRDTGSREELLEEASNINRSLLALGKCIAALVDAKGRDRHIPYRDSNLTKLLSDSLGGAGVTLMIACVSPSAANLQETLNTLRYSSRARKVKNWPVVKWEHREKLLGSLQQEIHLLRKENMLLRQQISSFGTIGTPAPSTKPSGSGSIEPGTVHIRPISITCPEDCLNNLLQGFMLENDKLQQDKRMLLDCQESSDQQRELLSKENIRLKCKLEELRRLISSSPNPDRHHSGVSHQGWGTRLHFAHHPPAFLPPLSHPCLPVQHCLCPCQPVLHCCVSNSTLQTYSNWPVRRCNLEDTTAYEALPNREMVYTPGKYRQGVLPPLPALSSNKEAQVLTENTMIWPGHRSHDPDPESATLRGLKSQLECMGMDECFQETRDSRAQRLQLGEAPSPVSWGRLVPSAPPLPPPVSPFRSRSEGRRRVEQPQGI